MCGYFYADKVVQKRKKRKLRKSALVQAAIAFIAHQPGQTRHKATALVLSLCENLPPESYEPMLRGIASCSITSISEQILLIQSKNFIGDLTCENNARSPYLRCAIRPERETCEGCQYYSKTDF
nr:DUF6464 family protein [Nostoc sp. NMS7]